MTALLAACRDREIHTCLDTSGFAPADALHRAARAADLILYDIKAVNSRLHREITGAPSEPVLENLIHLDRLGTPFRLRFPLIPGYTDRENNMADILDFLLANTACRDIHVLPFHNTAAAKYRQLDMTPPAIDAPAEDKIEAAVRRFRDHGFNVTVGG